MIVFTKDVSHCPRCQHTYLVRHRRRWWMKLLRVDQNLRCGNCRTTILNRDSKQHPAEDAPVKHS